MGINLTGLTKQQIRERIKVEEIWVTTRTSLIPWVVPESVMRYIVQLRVCGDTQQLNTLDIEKLEEDASYTMKFSLIPVAPAAMVAIPENLDIEQPVLVTQGGTQITGSVTGNSLQVTTTFWEDGIL